MRRFLAILFSVVLLAVACGGSSDDGNVSADAGGANSSGNSSDEDNTDDAGADDSTDADSDDAGADDSTDADTDGGSDDSGDTGSGSAADTEFADLLRSAVGSTAEIGTGRMAATMTMAGGPDLPVPVEILLSGEFDFPNTAVALQMDMSGMIDAMADSDDPDAALAGSFFGEPIEIIQIGGTSWIKMGLLAMFLGEDVEWIELTEDEFTAADQFLPGATGAFDPQEFVGFLNGAGGVEDLGSEQVRGVDTTHYRGTITQEMLAQFDPDSDMSDVSSTEEMPFEVWVDGDGLIRRLVMEISDTGDGSSMTLDWEMYDFGEAIDITPPPADQVTSGDQIGALLGG
ncbi:MAG: LppX_LprAFG lipoprotein [Actinomycetia bacterium]|nr:LppX_LprAFG lipoprotein [Actinomycetes bacterium]